MMSQVVAMLFRESPWRMGYAWGYWPEHAVSAPDERGLSAATKALNVQARLASADAAPFSYKQGEIILACQYRTPQRKASFAGISQ